MSLSLNGATTIRSSLRQDVDAAAATGFMGLEIWLPKLNAALEQESLAQIREHFNCLRIKPLTINSLEGFNSLDRAGHERMMIEAERMCRLANQLGVESLVVVPSPRKPGITDQEVFDDILIGLKELLAVSEPYKLKISLEFLGFKNCSVNTLGSALHVIRTINNPRLGLVIDAFHFYVGGSTLAELRQTRPEEIHIFHINDCEPGLVEEMTDDRRLYPGLGVIPLGEILWTLFSIGYDGNISIELFRPEYWEQPALQVAQECFTHIDKILRMVRNAISKPT